MQALGEEQPHEDEEEEADGPLLCQRLAEVDEPGAVRTLEQEVSQEDPVKWYGGCGYIEVEAEVDTGSCVSIMPSRVCKHVPTVPSAASRAKKQYRTAGSESIANNGQSNVRFWTEEGERRRMIWQRGDVNKALAGGGGIADQGNTLVFGPRGGAILKDPDGKIMSAAMQMASVKTPFRRKGNTYSMTMYVPIDEPQKGGANDTTAKKDLNNVQPRQGQEEMPDELDNIRAIVEEAGWTLVKTGAQKRKVAKKTSDFAGQD